MGIVIAETAAGPVIYISGLEMSREEIARRLAAVGLDVHAEMIESNTDGVVTVDHGNGRTMPLHLIAGEPVATISADSTTSGTITLAEAAAITLKMSGDADHYAHRPREKPDRPWQDRGGRHDRSRKHMRSKKGKRR